MPNRIIAVPADLLEAVANLELPASTQEALARLMSKHTEGRLSPAEQEEFQALVDLNERIAVLKGRARLLLPRRTENAG